MTERERIEREVILDILLESSRWERTDSDMDSIRAEVTDRARRLLGIDIKPPEAMSVLERGAARAAEKHNRHGKLAPGKHRVSIDGRKVTVDESMLVKEPYKCSPTGYRWVVKPEVMQGETVPLNEDNND